MLCGNEVVKVNNRGSRCLACVNVLVNLVEYLAVKPLFAALIAYIGGNIFKNVNSAVTPCVMGASNVSRLAL